MKTLIFVIAVIVLTGCASVVPVSVKFPEPPGRGAMTACKDLKKLQDTAKLSDVARTVAENYTMYYECAVKTDTWIDWYNAQRTIFESAGK